MPSLIETNIITYNTKKCFPFRGVLLLLSLVIDVSSAFEMKFLCLLSPTKALAEKSCSTLASKSACLPNPISALATPRSILIQRAKELKKAEIKSLMGLSDNLSQLNYERYENFEEQPQYQAGWLFDGPSFQKLNINDFNKIELDRLDSSLCILSGLYGFLRPSDPMQPYRLEMGTRLSVDGEKNLYDFWGKHGLTKQVASLVADDSESRCILNCASQEYSKVLNFDELRNDHGLKVIDIVFQASNGGRMASVYAKQARGMFVRFVAKADPSSLEELQRFTGDGHYVFASQSDENKLVFERHATAQSAGDDASWNDTNSTAKTKKASKGKVSKKSPASAKRTAAKNTKTSGEKRRKTRSSR